LLDRETKLLLLIICELGNERKHWTGHRKVESYVIKRIHHHFITYQKQSFSHQILLCASEKIGKQPQSILSNNQNSRLLSLMLCGNIYN
jgi:hypothetical protein